MTQATRNNTAISAWGICKKHRKAYSLVVVIAVLLSVLFSVCQPKEYDARAKISIDMSDDDAAQKGSWLMNLTKKFGMDGTLVTNEPEVYTTILRSQTFLQGIAHVKIRTDAGVDKTFQSYLADDCKRPFWTWHDSDTIEEMRQHYVRCELNRRNGLVVIQATAQSPRIAAVVLDSTIAHLQAFITQYQRTSTSNQTIALKQQAEQAEARYKQLQREYSLFLDSHSETALPSEQVEEDFLLKQLNQAQVDFSDAHLLYLQNLRKEERSRQLIYQVHSITTPIAPSRPNFLLNAAVWLFYSLLLATWFIFFREKRRQRALSATSPAE